MATMNVFLSDPMKERVEAQTRSGSYSDAGDYVRDLIRRDQERVDRTITPQRSITEGLDSVDIYARDVSDFGVVHAERYHEGLIATFALLADNPHMARERYEFSPPVRLGAYRSHMTVYVLDMTGILTVFVLYAWQD